MRTPDVRGASALLFLSACPSLERYTQLLNGNGDITQPAVEGPDHKRRDEDRTDAQPPNETEIGSHQVELLFSGEEVKL